MGNFSAKVESVYRNIYRSKRLCKSGARFAEHSPYCDCRSGHRYFDRDCYRDGKGAAEIYKVSPRVLNGICSVYVAMFRGTPMVVQLLAILLMFFFRSSDGT